MSENTQGYKTCDENFQRILAKQIEYGRELISLLARHHRVNEGLMAGEITWSEQQILIVYLYTMICLLLRPHCEIVMEENIKNHSRQQDLLISHRDLVEVECFPDGF